MKAEDKFNFGKYRGQTLKKVNDNDPDYLLWCEDNVKGFKIEDKEIFKFLIAWEKGKMFDSPDDIDYGLDE